MRRWTCSACGVEKPVSDFYRARTKRGHQTHCKLCMIERAKTRYRETVRPAMVESLTKRCIQCASIYRARKTSQRFCSVRCQQWWHQGIPSDREALKVCEWCGEQFDSARTDRRTCSSTCSAKHRAQRARGDHMTRARRLGVPWESFTREEVFERDGWICSLCGDPIDAELAHPHPMSASLDHVVPMARGGGHVKANTAAAHLVCNLRKGARTEASRTRTPGPAMATAPASGEAPRKS